MIIIKDSFRVELEMEQKMSNESKKMFETYYECRAQFRFLMYSKNKKKVLLTESEKKVLISQFIGKYTTYTKKEILYGELDEKGKSNGKISISEFDLVYYTLKDKIESMNILINTIDEEIDNGFDIYLGNINDIHKIKRYLSRGYFVQYTHSKKIMGHNSLKTRDLYRHSMLINVYNLNIGDCISIKGEEYYIKSIDKQNLNVINLKTSAKSRFHFNTIKEYLSKID